MRMNRLPTTVEGLDDILSGGLFQGGVYILEGPPGVGKTTLANQIAYSHARKGTKTLYVTMLAESHARMLQHMQDQTFFDQHDVNSKVFYLSGYRELGESGLKGVVDLLRGELSRSNASILVVDGLVVENRALTPADSVREFIHELQSMISAMSCTCLVLTSGQGSVLSAEQTMVDGILSFEDHSFHWRAERRMLVRKFRGCHVIRGQHTFCITNKGLQFFPRIESLPVPTGDCPYTGVRVQSGLPSMDGVLQGGGLLAGSASILIGNTGAGKTTVALAFAAQATIEEPALLLTSTESIGDLQSVGHELGLPVAERLDMGALTIGLFGHEDESMDEMGHKVLRLVDELKARRLVVDGLAGLADTLAFPERGYRFLGRLLADLKRRGVTSLFTVDPAALAAAAGTPLAEGVVGWFDNALTFPVEMGQSGEARRPMAITKVRGGRASKQLVDVHIESTRLVS